MDRTIEYDSQRKKRRAPPKLTADYLRAQAFRHLERYSCSAWQLQRVLMRRVDKCVRFHGGSREEGAELAKVLVAELVAKRVVDDGKFAAAWVDSLHRRGIPVRGIRARLRQKGVAADHVEAALQALEAEVGGDPELQRACSYARRRRLGPLRHDLEQREARAQKDLAAMARAGFPYAIAQRVVFAEDFDALVEEAQGR